VTPAPILAALLALAPWHGDRSLSRAEREAMLRPVAEAIAAASRTREDAAFLVTQGWFESKYARAVLSGHCDEMPRGMRCDPDRNGVPRARGAWQLWSFCKATDVNGEARCVLGTAHLGLQRCGSWDAAFGALTGRWACTMRPERTHLMRKILAGWGKR
jgi:hypothetical protein